MINNLNIYDRPTFFFLLLIIVIYIDVSIVGVTIQFNLFSLSDRLGIIFLILIPVTIFSIVIILIHIKKLIQKHQKILGNDLIISSKLVIIAQSIILILLTIVSSQMISQNKYNFILSTFIVLISYSIGLLFNGILSIKFLKWYKIGKEKMILLNFISIISILLILIFSLLYFLYENIDNINIIVDSKNIYQYIHTTSPIPNLFLNYYNTSVLVTFISIWIISMYILRFHLQSLNIYLYILLYSIPLIYFLFNSLSFTQDLQTSIILRLPQYYDMMYTALFTGSGIITGLLFFLPMWIFAKKIANNEIKQFLSLASFGMLIFFTINTLPPLSEKWFPPFGIISSSLTGLSIFLIFNGLYSTAIYLSKIKYFTNISLKTLENEKYFRIIARSQLEEELKKIISKAIEKDAISVKKDELSNDEIVNLISIVKKEVKELENRRKNNRESDINSNNTEER